MRSTAGVLPLLVFLALLVFSLFSFADVLPYRALVEDEASQGEPSGGRRVYAGAVAPSGEPLVVRVRPGHDLLTGLSSVEPPESELAIWASAHGHRNHLQ